MTAFNVIHKDSPSQLLSDAVREWMDAGSPMTGDDLISTGRTVKCELDGEPMGGVYHASIEIDQDGDACLMLFRDSTLAAHVAAGNGVTLPLAVAVRPRHEH